MNFQRLEEGDFQEIDINNIPSENIQIMANGGLSLKSYSREAVLGVELSVIQDFGYISPESLSVLSLGGEDDFGTLSDLVTANANLFEYKGDNVSLGDGLSIAEAEILNTNDYNALNFSFTEDEIFNSAYYYDRNPDVADDGINPYTHYFLSGAYAPEFRDPTFYFDSSFYLETYTDVADDGINPLLHYFSSGADELRDPDPAYDTSFYLETYTDVAEDGINPLLHYYFTNDSEVRYTNETFKTLGETGEAIFVSSEISDADFELFKDDAFSVIETRELEGTEVAGVVFAIPVIYKGVSLIGIGLLSLEILNRTNEIQELLDDESANILWIPDNEEVFKDNNLEKFPLAGFEELSGETPPFDTGEVTGFDDNVFFPKGDNVLEQVLTGQFENPLDDESDFSYFLAVQESNEILRDLRDSSIFVRKTGGGTRQYNNTSGGFERANEFFDSLGLSNVQELTNSQYEGRRGDLDDGRRIIVREGSKGGESDDGFPTVEIQNSRGRIKDKFRFKGQD